MRTEREISAELDRLDGRRYQLEQERRAVRAVTTAGAGRVQRAERDAVAELEQLLKDPLTARQALTAIAFAGVVDAPMVMIGG